MQLISTTTAILGSLFALAIFVVDVIVAIGVYQDATAREKAGKKLLFLTPARWSFVCLLTCLTGFALYWLMHYSTISNLEAGEKEK